MCNRRSTLACGKKSIRYRLVDGATEDRHDRNQRITLYHTTDVIASEHDIATNKLLKSRLDQHILAMCKAYTLMQLHHKDLTDQVFEHEIRRVMEDRVVAFELRNECLYERLLRYIEEAHRDGVMGEYRYRQMKGKAKKLHRFLFINGLSGISAKAFDVDLLMRFRQFIYDEYLYVAAYPGLYPTGYGCRPPKKRCRDNTVVHDLKALKAFFGELENSGEIDRSPFSRISGEKRRSIMHVMYDDPYYLRASELRHVMECAVPAELQSTKDIFVLNCALGCRIGDLKRLSMDKFAVSPTGIPYIHYIPTKTAGTQKTNREIQTPLIRQALEIVQRTRFAFNGRNPDYERQVYNKKLRRLLRHCGINRRVCVYDPEKRDNVYLPICDIASSRLARKTHVDMLNKVQINFYAAGLHRTGSEAVFRYTSLELADRYALLQAAFEGVTKAS